MGYVRVSCQTRTRDEALQEVLGQLLPEAAVIQPPSPPPTIWIDIASSNETPPCLPLSNRTVPFLGLFPWLPLLVHKRSPQLQSFLHSCLGPALLTNPPPNFFTHTLSEAKQTETLASVAPAPFSSVSPFSLSYSSEFPAQPDQVWPIRQFWIMASPFEGLRFLFHFVYVFWVLFCLFCFGFVALFKQDWPLTYYEESSFFEYFSFFLLYSTVLLFLSQTSKEPDQFQECPWAENALITEQQNSEFYPLGLGLLSWLVYCQSAFHAECKFSRRLQGFFSFCFILFFESLQWKFYCCLGSAKQL